MELSLVYKVIGVGMIVMFSGLVLDRADRKDQSMLVSVAGIVAVLLLYLSVFLYAMAQLGGLLGTVRTWLDSAGASVPHADVLLRAAGISLLSAAAAALCEENGQRAAARALELLGVVEVILAAQPILSDLFGFAEKMLLN